jgi:hypothetical protein
MEEIMVRLVLFRLAVVAQWYDTCLMMKRSRVQIQQLLLATKARIIGNKPCSLVGQ